MVRIVVRYLSMRELASDWPTEKRENIRGQSVVLASLAESVQGFKTQSSGARQEKYDAFSLVPPKH
jgi:hypothetical protein